MQQSSKPAMVTRTFAALALSLLICSPLLGAAAQDLDPTQISVIRSYASGLVTLTFLTPAGDVTVFLPDDVMVGDTVSGTIRIEPAGDTPRQRRLSREFLQNHFLVIDGEGTPLSSAMVTWNIGLEPAVQLGSVTLEAIGGAEVATGEVAVCEADETEPMPTEPLAPDSGAIFLAPPGGHPSGPGRAENPELFTIPGFAQAGHAFPIAGKFDGFLLNTQVTLGGIALPVLAESPRGLVVAAPADLSGRLDLELREGGIEVRRPFNSITVSLAAPATGLRAGDELAMEVTVDGLEGLASSVPLMLTNHSPDVVRFQNVEGTMTQRIIEPSEVDGTGRCTFELPMMATASGVFQIVARVTSTTSTHYKNVTFAPHVADYSWHPGPPLKQHLEGTTFWEPHVTGVSFSPRGHKSGVTWQAHTTDVTFSNEPHVTGATWTPHTEGVSFPNRHNSGVTWTPHTDGVSFGTPPHVDGVSHKPHLAGYTYNYYGHTSGVSWAPHTTGVTYPPTNQHVAGTTFTPHTSGVSFPPGHKSGVSWPPHTAGQSFPP